MQQAKADGTLRLKTGKPSKQRKTNAVSQRLRGDKFQIFGLKTENVQHPGLLCTC